MTRKVRGSEILLNSGRITWLHAPNVVHVFMRYARWFATQKGTNMKLKELIEALQECYDQVEGDYDADTAEDVEVRLAIQPNWPFEHSLTEVEMCDRADHEDEDDAPDSDDPQIIVYLGEGNQIGYLPGHVKEQLCW